MPNLKSPTVTRRSFKWKKNLIPSPKNWTHLSPRFSSIFHQTTASPEADSLQCFEGWYTGLKKMTTNILPNWWSYIIPWRQTINYMRNLNFSSARWSRKERWRIRTWSQGHWSPCHQGRRKTQGTRSLFEGSQVCCRRSRQEVSILFRWAKMREYSNKSGMGWNCGIRFSKTKDVFHFRWLKLECNRDQNDSLNSFIDSRMLHHLK